MYQVFYENLTQADVQIQGGEIMAKEYRKLLFTDNFMFCKVVVFICTFDYFGKGLPFYVFENRYGAMPELLPGDGTRKVFVNPYGNRSGLPENVVHFLDYIRDNRAGD